MFIISLFKNLFHVYSLFHSWFRKQITQINMFMHVCLYVALCTWMKVPMEARRGCQVFWIWSHGQLWDAICDLGNRFEFSASIATCALTILSRPLVLSQVIWAVYDFSDLVLLEIYHFLSLITSLECIFVFYFNIFPLLVFFYFYWVYPSSNVVQGLFQ